MPTLQCSTCLRAFTAARSDAKHCSPACRNRASHNRQRGGENRPRLKPGRPRLGPTPAFTVHTYVGEDIEVFDAQTVPNGAALGVHFIRQRDLRRICNPAAAGSRQTNRALFGVILDHPLTAQRAPWHEVDKLGVCVSTQFLREIAVELHDRYVGASFNPKLKTFKDWERPTEADRERADRENALALQPRIVAENLAQFTIDFDNAYRAAMKAQGGYDR